MKTTIKLWYEEKYLPNKRCRKLRSRVVSKNVDIDFSERKLGDKFNRAGKIANFAIVVGETEANSQKFVAKNLETGETTEL